jgi:hypothetical protein
MKKMLAVLSLFVSFGLVAQEPAPVQTRVSITSQPSGATVIVDGQDRGVTPVVLFDLSPGRHHLKFRKAGYVEADRFFRMDEGPVIEKNEVLVEEKGLLLIKTDPEGCDIQIDGVSVGKSPRLISHLASKDVYKIRLRKAGYLDQIISVKFDGRAPQVREEKLVLASGAISISSEPSGAEVTVNGVPRGVTPLNVDGIPKGRASVKLHLDGYMDEIRDLAIKAGDELNLPIVMKALPGTLHLVSKPEGARFYVNGEARGQGPVVIPGLQPGEYEVRAEKDGFGSVSRTVEITNGASKSEEFVLSNIMGGLELKTSPIGAEILLDDKVIGVSKPTKNPAAIYSDIFSLGSIPEGEYQLRIRKEGYEDLVKRVKIVNKKTKQMRITLKRIFTPDVIVTTDRDKYKGVHVSTSPDGITVEVKLGIMRTFPHSEVRKIEFIKPSTK